jgi:hypothetical protein
LGRIFRSHKRGPLFPHSFPPPPADATPPACHPCRMTTTPSPDAQGRCRPTACLCCRQVTLSRRVRATTRRCTAAWRPSSMGRSAFCPPTPGGWHGLRCHERPEPASGLRIVQTDHPSPAGLMGANEFRCRLASGYGLAGGGPARGGGPPAWRSAISRSLEASMDWASSSRTAITVRSLTLNFTQRCPPRWS